MGVMNLNDTISAFRCCTQIPPMCKECPLTEMCKWNLSKDRCKNEVKLSVNHWLKAQEPRLVTESDFDGSDIYGYIPVWTEEKDGDMYWECIPKAAITDSDGIGVLRYWTSRPDEKRRAETPWIS